jgi:hypothetical protein
MQFALETGLTPTSASPLFLNLSSRAFSRSLTELFNFPIAEIASVELSKTTRAYTGRSFIGACIVERRECFFYFLWMRVMARVMKW